MGQKLYEAFTKQDNIMSQIEALYSHVISSQEDDELGIIFTFTEIHNIKAGGSLTISGVTIDGESDIDYNNSFLVDSIVSTTKVRVLKTQELFGVVLTYDATAIFTSSVVTNLRVHNDPTLDFDVSDYPILIVDVDDTVVNRNNVGFFIPDETLFPLFVMHRLDNFAVGDKTQLRGCRYFVAYKMQEILELIMLKTVANVSRSETIWGSEEVSVIGTTVKK